MQLTNIFAVSQPRLRDYLKKGEMDVLTRFVGATPGTVQGWVKGTPCKGERLLRLWHFLSVAGFDSPEMQAIPKYNLYLSELFAFSVITMDEVLNIAGVRNEQTGLQILRGQPPMAPTLSFEELYEMYDEQLQSAKSALAQQLGRTSSSTPVSSSTTPSPAPAPAPPVVPAVVQSPPTSVGVPTVVVAATTLLNALAFANYMNSPEVTPAERQKLRELMGETAMFELSNVTSALCGERARSQQTR